MTGNFKDFYIYLFFVVFVQILLENKADVDCKTEEEKTPFHLAAENGHVE